MVESVPLPGICGIRESTEKLSGQVLEKGTILCEYRKTVESVRVLGIGRIRESTEKVIIFFSTGK